MRGDLVILGQHEVRSMWPGIATGRRLLSTSLFPNLYHQFRAHFKRYLETHGQGVLGAVVDLLQACFDIVYPLIEVALVESVQIGQVNLEPSQTSFA